ncbi:MAG: DEAD/DEAH box helicase [bacterium]|nr:DEAD/DEAH box helicase [bacterium]
MLKFEELALIPELIQSLKSAGYDTPTPIQAQSIPHLLEGKDLLGIAQTGTGKTAAFALPILNHLALSGGRAKPGHCRALILTPTRELASQIFDSLKTYGKNLRMHNTVIFGGVNQNPQVRAMLRGVDVLVATPGRLMDLMNQGQVHLGQVEVFVLDEADRMLDMGFINDIRKISAKVPQQRQTLLFSATMPKDIAALAASLLKDPVRVEISPESTTVERITQKVMLVQKSQKSALLRDILAMESIDQALVFSRTKRGADRLVSDLSRYGVPCDAIHGNKTQSARQRSLGNFRSGKLRVLVATDIAARGIDVAGISHVINYDLPNEPESYVHRIGRTARAGREGTAISFCDASERPLLLAIERSIRKKLPRHEHDRIDFTAPHHQELPLQPEAALAAQKTHSQKHKPKTHGTAAVTAGPGAAAGNGGSKRPSRRMVTSAPAGGPSRRPSRRKVV